MGDDWVIATFPHDAYQCRALAFPARALPRSSWARRPTSAGQCATTKTLTHAPGRSFPPLGNVESAALGTVPPWPIKFRQNETPIRHTCTRSTACWSRTIQALEIARSLSRSSPTTRPTFSKTSAPILGLYAAARVVAVRSANDVEWPVRWRQAVCAVELCQRAAQTAAAPPAAAEVPEILAEGESAVIAFLEQTGVPSDFVDLYFGAGGHEGEPWPGGRWINELCDDTRMVTLTERDDGMFRLQSGPAELFWELTNPPDDY